MFHVIYRIIGYLLPVLNNRRVLLLIKLVSLRLGDHAGNIKQGSIFHIENKILFPNPFLFPLLNFVPCCYKIETTRQKFSLIKVSLFKCDHKCRTICTSRSPVCSLRSVSWGRLPRYNSAQRSQHQPGQGKWRRLSGLLPFSRREESRKMLRWLKRGTT